jgi:hypothetical protein
MKGGNAEYTGFANFLVSGFFRGNISHFDVLWYHSFSGLEDAPVINVFNDRTGV